MEVMPRIELYKDYRNFISDYYAYKKAQRSGFSFRQFSKLAGFSSPNYIQLVMQGNRNLSESMATGLAKAMLLKESESRYFEALVRQENSKTDDELKKSKEAGLRALKKLISKHIDKSKHEVLTHWHHLLVREVVQLKNFEANGDYIAQKLRGLISPEQAEESLRILLRAGFLAEKSGQWTVTDPVLDTGEEVFSQLTMNQYHSENLKLWASRLSSLEAKTSELGILNLSIPSKKIPELKKRIRDFQDEVLGWLSNEDQADAVVQVGTYLIPWTDEVP